MERTIRNRSVEYRVSFLARKTETYIYIGSMWAGRIVHAHTSAIHKEEKFGVFLQLPGMWGPVAREDSLMAAKLVTGEAIKRWLATFTGTPEPPPEQIVKRVAKQQAQEEVLVATRVRRTRQPAPSTPVKRVSRTRT